MDALAALQHGFAPALASALLHSLWQGTLLALAAACALAAMARHAAAARHQVAMGFLAMMVLLPAVAFLRFWRLPGEQLNAGWLPVMTVVEPVDVPGVFARESSPVPDVVVLLWLLGVALVLLRHAGGLWTIRAMTRAPHESLSPAWQARMRQLREAMGIARDVVVHVSKDVLTPCAARVLRPVIWLPASLLARMPADQLEALLAHELAHIARKDWLWNGLQCVFEALLFFHPAAWWLGRRIRQEREHACDDLAVAACGDAIVLAEALAALERQRHASPHLALAANGGSLMQRITRLLSAPPTRGTWVARIALGLVLAGGGLIAAQAAFSGGWRPDLNVYSTTDGKLGPGDMRKVEARGVDGRRVYRATVDARGRLVETYEKDGQARPIDAGVRRWLAEIDRLSVPPPPAPPPPPPAPPPPPDVRHSTEFKALMRVVAANAEVVAQLGSPVSVVDAPFGGNLRLEDGQGDADLRIKLRGAKGVADVHVIADLNDGAWSLASIELD
jgi:beta-lactamase regulating signal transducer with metallopeptidase domain